MSTLKTQTDRIAKLVTTASNFDANTLHNLLAREFGSVEANQLCDYKSARITRIDLLNDDLTLLVTFTMFDKDVVRLYQMPVTLHLNSTITFKCGSIELYE